MRIPSLNGSLLLLFPQLFNQIPYPFVDPYLPYRIIEGRIPPELGQLAPDRYEGSASMSFFLQCSGQESSLVSEPVVADDDFDFDGRPFITRHVVEQVM
jgi:hypothetical protein